MKVLILRFSSIGDIVLTTPVIRAVHQQAGAEVHFLTKRSFAGVLKHNPYLTKVWTIDKEINEISGDLKAESFDAIIDLHNNLRTRRLGLHLRKSKLYRFNKLNGKKWLLTNLKINRLPKVHIVDRYLAAAAALGVKNDGQGLDYFLGPEDIVVPEQFGLPREYLAFVIGAAHATKRLPEDQILAICQACPYPIILLGGPGEKEIGERLTAAAGAGVYNACGSFKLGQSASLVQQAKVVLTHDTGLMHIAAAFHKPILSVWGNTVPAFGMYPYLPGQEEMESARRLEIEGLSCRPCSKIGHANCPKGHFRCMRDLNHVIVVAEIQTVWSSLSGD